MRIFLLFLLLSLMGWVPLKAQQQQPILLDTMLRMDPAYVALLLNAVEYHQALVKRDVAVIKNRTSKQLRYGHSNGWVESQKQQLKNLETGYLVYHSFKEDSMSIYLPSKPPEFIINGQLIQFGPRFNNRATLVFKATIDVSKEGKRNTYLLSVAEVWEKKSKKIEGWHLTGRKALPIGSPPQKH